MVFNYLYCRCDKVKQLDNLLNGSQENEFLS